MRFTYYNVANLAHIVRPRNLIERSENVKLTVPKIFKRIP